MSSSTTHISQGNKPYNRRQPIARSKSFLGTIKNLVTAPLTWFASNEDIRSKRRRLPQSSPGDDLVEDNVSRSKRPRVNSPDRQVEPGYLDPPETIFRQSGGSHSMHPSVPSNLHTRSLPVFTPYTQRPSHNRHSVAPPAHKLDSRPMGVSRTMSLDPPYQPGRSRDSTRLHISRDATMDSSSFRHSMSISRDVSMPPAHTPFRMGTSLTPQPSNSNFGSSLPRDRDPSEPPPVTSLMSNPMFVRAPSDAYQQRSMSVQPTVTLGSIVDSQRSVRGQFVPHQCSL
jgi:nucleoporin NUP1